MREGAVGGGFDLYATFCHHNVRGQLAYISIDITTVYLLRGPGWGYIPCSH